MGSILDFRPRKIKQTSRREASAAATVIIFPGVRYERYGTAPEPEKWSPVDWRVWQKPNQMPAQ